MQSSTVSGVSLSFTGHSSSNLQDVAARVVQEFRHENGDDYDDIINFNNFDNDNADEKADTNTQPKKLKDDKDCDDDEFEFAVVCADVNPSSNSADEIFSQGGHIWPQYPLFDTSLLLDVNGSSETDCKPSLVVRLPLRKLFSEERDFTEAEDLDGVTPGTYCVWKPKPELPERSKKSNSTGNSSRRWKLRDILYRSNSEGKETPFLLFKPSNKKINSENVKKVEKSAKVAAAVGDGASDNPSNKAENRGSRRRSYLPSGQALVGAFSHVSRSNRYLVVSPSSEIRTDGGGRCRQSLVE
ncbi:hypothetical protein LXL04_009546 [Taraxacum kok-saghyz]